MFCVRDEDRATVELELSIGITTVDFSEFGANHN